MSWFHRNIVQGFGMSSSNWENSWFGGYERILFEFPDIKIHEDLEFEYTEKSLPISWYSHRQLVKMFLLKVKKFKQIDVMSCFMTEEKTNHFGREMIKCSVDGDQLSIVISNVLEKEAELYNLFQHYREVLEGTSFFYYKNPPPVPSPLPEGTVIILGKSDKSDQSQDNKDTETTEEEEKEEDDSEDDSEDDIEKKRKDTEEKKEEFSPFEDVPRTFKNNTNKEFVLILKVTSKRKYNYQYSNGWNNESALEVEFKQMTEHSPCVYSHHEIKLATHLSKMLDINFDMKSDRIQNLRTGKLDPGKICEQLGGNFNIYTREETNQATRPFSVCILGDESGSMGSDHKLQTQIQTIKILYKAFSETIPADRIYVYGHTSLSTNIEIRTYNDRYNNTFDRTIESMANTRRGGTPCPIVINAIYNKIRETISDNMLFIYTCDGQPDGGLTSREKIKKIVERNRRDGFASIGIGILSSAVKGIYPYNTVVDDLGTMVQKVSTIVNHVVKTEFQS